MLYNEPGKVAVMQILMDCGKNREPQKSQQAKLATICLTEEHRNIFGMLL